MRRLMIIAFMGSVFFPAIVHAQLGAAYDRCRVVAELMARDESSDNFDLKIRSQIYEQVCEGSQVKDGFNFESAGTILTAGFFGDGSLSIDKRKENVRNFCRTFKKEDSLDLYRSGVSSRVVREAIAAWQGCINANQEVQIDVASSSPAGFTVALIRGRQPATFEGIKVYEGKIRCQAAYAPIGGGRHGIRVVNEKTRFHLRDGAARAISCTRVPMVDKDGNEFLPQVSLSVITNYGLMPITLSADTRFGSLAYVSQWKSKLQDLENSYKEEITRLQARKPAAQLICNGRLDGQSHVQDISYPSSCPAGTTFIERRQFLGPGGRGGRGQLCILCASISK